MMNFVTKEWWMKSVYQSARSEDYNISDFVSSLRVAGIDVSVNLNALTSLP